jgi:hypothetical protein
MGSPWIPPVIETNSESVKKSSGSAKGSTVPTDDDALSDLSELSEENIGAELPDIGLANAIVFIRDAIWWIEACRAVAVGDAGRVLEIFKVIQLFCRCSMLKSLGSVGYLLSLEAGIRTTCHIYSRHIATSSMSSPMT